MGAYSLLSQNRCKRELWLKKQMNLIPIVLQFTLEFGRVLNQIRDNKTSI